MGLFVYSRVIRFIGAVSSEAFATASGPLMEGFFASLPIGAVSVGSDSRRLHGSEASAECGRRIAESSLGFGGSPGFSLKLHSKRGHTEEWVLLCHRGPFPALDIQTTDSSRFVLNRKWAEEFVAKGTVDIVWLEGLGYFGSSNDIYIYLKQQRLFPYSRGSSSKEAIGAGQQIRKLCQQQMTRFAREAPRLVWIRPAKRKKLDFLRSFDTELFKAANYEEFSSLLNVIGTKPEDWREPEH